MVKKNIDSRARRTRLTFGLSHVTQVVNAYRILGYNRGYDYLSTTARGFPFDLDAARSYPCPLRAAWHLVRALTIVKTMAESGNGKDIIVLSVS